MLIKCYDGIYFCHTHLGISRWGHVTHIVHYWGTTRKLLSLSDQGLFDSFISVDGNHCTEIKKEITLWLLCTCFQIHYFLFNTFLSVLFDRIVLKSCFFYTFYEMCTSFNFCIVTWVKNCPYSFVVFSTCWIILNQAIGSATFDTRGNGAIMGQNGSPVAASVKIRCDKL